MDLQLSNLDTATERDKDSSKVLLSPSGSHIDWRGELCESVDL
jgi:hypothetical protein